MIDIIIPCYNAKETITETLVSLCLQINSNDLNVYLINDCSDYNYKFYIDFFSNFINIQELRTPTNAGPGGAREYGIQNSDNRYIMFMDSDDHLYTYDSVYELYQEIQKKNYDLVYSDFLYIRDNEIKIMDSDLTWLHGKIYDRTFINAKDLHFNNTRANEDNGFNRLLLLLSNNYHHLSKTTYVYNENPNSITRRNNREYRFTGLEGFIYNMNWAIKNALVRGANKRLVTVLAINVLIAMYYYYLELYNEYDVKKLLEWSVPIKKFLINNKYLNDEDYDKLIEIKRKEYNANNKFKEIITFREFIDKIDEYIQ